MTKQFKLGFFCFVLIIICLICSCGETEPLIDKFSPSGEYVLSYNDKPEIKDESKIKIGGFSGLHYKGQREFYTITNRGPVLTKNNEVYYLSEEYTPEIILLELQDDNSIKIKDRTPIQSITTENISGISPQTPWGTTETIVNSNVNNNEWGINPGGLHFDAENQVFWISDLYAPGIYAAAGEEAQVYKRIRPGEGLRKIYSTRINNGGMSGITFQDDFCYATIKYALENVGPNNTASDIDYTVRRIAKFDISKHKNDFPSSELSMVYLVDDETKDGINPKNIALGDIVFYNDTTLIVSEYGEVNGVKRSLIYAAVITDSTSQLLDGFESIAGKTIETLSEIERKDKDSKIVPLKKRLIADLSQYEIYKPEGLTLIGEKKLAIIDSDNFGITNADPRNKSYNVEEGKTRLIVINLNE